jgi:YidC/Oxa1 family membrane protein insertase
MDFVNLAILNVLDQLKLFLGSYGWAIVALTVLLRLLVWPLNAQQSKQMKQMQAIQPKMKELQERYKDNPQQMQMELMKLYQTHKFNPFAGCLPLLIQLPLFIALYGALVSPAFLQRAGQDSFFFIDKLHHTLFTQGGEAFDQKFAVENNDKFVADQQWKLRVNGQTEPMPYKLADLRITDPKKILMVEPKPLIPGQTIKFQLMASDLGASPDFLSKVESIDVPVSVESTKEMETLTLKPNESKTAFLQEVPSTKANRNIHWDVLVLIAVYGALSWLFQVSNQKMMGDAAASGQQAMLMKWMPLVFLLMMFMVPIPAGVMIYLIVTMLMMWIQNVVAPTTQDADKAKPNAAGSSSSGASTTVTVKAE